VSLATCLTTASANVLTLSFPPSLRGPGLVSSKAATMLHRVRFRGRRSGRAGTGNQAGNAGRVGGVREHACGSEDRHRGDDAGHYRDGQGALFSLVLVGQATTSGRCV
jgi:hypothetical protein